MQEIEAKFYVSNLDRIQASLESLQARLLQERILETNIRFDLPGGGLRSEGRVLRLRQDSHARLTYKSASSNEQGVLNRQEIEFVVDDFEKARLLLEALGYQKMFYYEKFRTTYELADCHVMLDEMPYGNFVEIEGETIDSIGLAANKLGLRWETAIPTSYHVLFDRLCSRHPDLDPKELSFPALKGTKVTAGELSILAGDA